MEWREVPTGLSVNEVGGEEGGEGGEGAMEMQRARADRAYRYQTKQQGSIGCE